MWKLSTERSTGAETIAVFLLTLVALVLLGCVLAYWTWKWFGPRPEPRVAVATEPRMQVAAANNLFGGVQRDPNVLPATEMAIKLLGVAAASGGRGHAIVQLDAKQTVVAREKDEIGPGIRLAEIHPDHVVLERNGTRERLAWPAKNPAPAPPPLPVKK